MTTNLSTLVPSLKRTLAVPGTFDTYFPETSNTDLKATLQDAFAECQMDGLLTNIGIDNTGEVDSELSPAQQSMVVLYANARVLTSEIRNRKTHVRYESGTTVFEQDQSAQAMVEQLKVLQDSKVQIRKNSVTMAGNLTYMVDAYVCRTFGFEPNMSIGHLGYW